MIYGGKYGNTQIYTDSNFYTGLCRVGGTRTDAGRKILRAGSSQRFHRDLLGEEQRALKRGESGQMDKDSGDPFHRSCSGA